MAPHPLGGIPERGMCEREIEILRKRGTLNGINYSVVKGQRGLKTKKGKNIKGDQEAEGL